MNEVDRGAIKLDQAQLSALRVLDGLHLNILTRVQHQQKSSGWIQSLRNVFYKKRTKTIKGVYLWGGVGTGKTLMMDMFFASLPKGIAKRTHFHRFMQSVHHEKSEIHNTVDPLEIIAENLVSKYSVLCLDEFTVSDITDAMILSGLLHKLFVKGVVLITTSNTQIDQLYLGGLQRDRFLPAIELLNQFTQSVEVDSGTDYRMQFLQNNAVFNIPADSSSFQRLREAFDVLSDNRDGFPFANRTSIEINGRSIRVVDASLGVVWFEFDAICRSNRSNSDFIEIAKQFHSVFVSGIPALGTDDDDAARRFIELIDELYDRNVNLLVSSNKPPNEIYSGKRLLQPFQRTSSRLTEMSSEDYLSQPHLA